MIPTAGASFPNGTYLILFGKHLSHMFVGGNFPIFPGSIGFLRPTKLCLRSPSGLFGSGECLMAFAGARARWWTAFAGTKRRRQASTWLTVRVSVGGWEVRVNYSILMCFDCPQSYLSLKHGCCTSFCVLLSARWSFCRTQPKDGALCDSPMRPKLQ